MQMLEYGTNIVAGVTPGRGGLKFQEAVPVFDAVETAVKQTGADTSIIFVPAPGAADAILEAADAGISLAICITEGVPALDMVNVLRSLPGIRHANHWPKLSWGHLTGAPLPCGHHAL